MNEALGTPCTKGRGTLALLKRGAPFVSPFRGRLLFVAFVAVIIALVTAGEPLVMRYLFDGLAGGSARRLAMALGALVSMMLVKELLAATVESSFYRVRVGVNYAITRATVDRLHSLPVAYHRENGVGATMTKVDRGISGFVTAFHELGLNLLPAVLYLVIAIAVMSQLDFGLTCVVLVFAPIPPILGARAAHEQSGRERDLFNRWTKITSRFAEVLSGIAVVKSFAAEENEKRRFLSGCEDSNRIVVRGVSTDARVTAAKNIIAAAARIVAVAYGGYRVLHGEMSVGTLVAFLGYIGGLFLPLQAITGIYQSVRRGTASLESVFSILDAQDSLGDAPDAEEVGQLRGEVAFDGVSFGYKADEPVLRDVSFHARAGETIALVGRSGSGKSTVAALLQRLYDTTSGSVRLDGRDIRGLKQRCVRKQIGVVLQDDVLFCDTVRANIVFGKPGASQAEVELAANAANAHDFIMALPQGYDTVVGDRGSRLSAGERQRIAIARALLKNPPILVLDEPTSALDPESEKQVRQALERLTANRTTLVIAHRPSTVAAADRVLVFNEGEIVEEREGTYQRAA